MKRKSIILIIAILALEITICISSMKSRKYSLNKEEKNKVISDVIQITVNPIGNPIDISYSSSDNVKGQLYDDGTLIISGTGKMKSYDGESNIWNNEYYTNTKNIKILEGITNIGEGIFYEFKNLNEIEIPSTVSEIGYAFLLDTNVSSIIVSDDNQYFTTENNILFNKQKTELVCYPPDKGEISYSIPEGIYTIRMDAFLGAKNLQELQISSTVSNEKMNTYSFSYINKLSNIKVDINNKYFTDIDGVLFNEEKTNLICYPNKLLETIYTVPNGVEEISENAFGIKNDLEEIILPEGVLSIGIDAFGGCKKLQKITIPKSVISLPSHIYVYNDITTVYVYCNSYADNFTKEHDNFANIKVIHEYENDICTICGKISENHQHIYGEWQIIQNATCKEKGIKRRECTLCDKNKAEELEYIDKLDHDYTEWRVEKEPTAYSDGLKSRYCIVCGEKEEDIIPKIDNPTPDNPTPDNPIPDNPIPDNPTPDNPIQIEYKTNYTVKNINNVKYIILNKATSGSIVLNNISNNNKLKILNSNNKVMTGLYQVATGMRILQKSNNEEIFVIVVKGDVSGDGQIDFISDIVPINNYRLGKSNELTKAQQLAGDINEDGKVDFISDIVSINNYRLGKTESL